MEAAILSRWTRMCWGAGNTGTARRTSCRSKRRRCRCSRPSTTPCDPSTTTSTQASRSCKTTTWIWSGRRIYQQMLSHWIIYYLKFSDKTSINVADKMRRRSFQPSEKSPDKTRKFWIILSSDLDKTSGRWNPSPTSGISQESKRQRKFCYWFIM